MLRNLTLAALSFALVLVGFELGLRGSGGIPHPYAHGTARAWWESAAPLNRYVPSEHRPGTHEFHPDPAILPGLRARARFTTNAYGFRSPRLASVEKPPGSLRVFMIGGSTTECLYLDEPDAWPEGVQRLLAAERAGVDVINVGHSGDTTRDHIALLAQRVVPFEPDVVVILAGINDMTIEIAADYSALRTDARSIIAVQQPSLRTLLQARLADFSQVARLAIWARRRLAEEPDAGAPRQDEYGQWIEAKRAEWRALPLVALQPSEYPRPEFRQNLRSLIGIAEANGARVVLLTQPALWGAPPGPWEARLWAARGEKFRISPEQAWQILERFNGVTREVAQSEHVALVDLASEIPKAPELFYDDDHFTVQGAARVSEAIARRLLADRVLPDPATPAARAEAPTP